KMISCFLPVSCNRFSTRTTFPSMLLWVQRALINFITVRSLNYGGIGVVIGHEITHGFDDRGRQFDKNGNMKQWWNNATIKRFRSRTECIIDQYSSYILDDIN